MGTFWISWSLYVCIYFSSGILFLLYTNNKNLIILNIEYITTSQDLSISQRLHLCIAILLKLAEDKRLRRLERVFRCYIVCETKEDYKEGCIMVWANYICLLATLLLGYTLRVLVTSYQLPWQRARFTKAASKFQFL